MNKNYNKMNNLTCTPKLALTLVFLAMSFSQMAFSQVPTVTVRFANPEFSCANDQYCLDVEFQSDTDSVQLFGMNVRFFYDDVYMEFDTITDFQGGYGPVSPNPPTVLTSPPGFGTNFFGFPAPGVADWVNGAVQLVDIGQPAIYIDTAGWTKLYQICFNVDVPLVDSNNFCPPVVWDLRLDPADGGYLAGDDGVVITVVEDPPAMSGPSNENVVQFNWMYVGDGSAPPFGEPEPTECISLVCIPVLTCVPDLTIDCSASTDTSSTGVPTSTAPCNADITLTYTDETIPGACAQDYIINREWIATNECGNADTCLQVITVIDTTAPTVICPPFITIDCTESTDPANTGVAVASDNCDPNPTVTYIDVIVLGDCPQEYTIDRIWIATDGCFNQNFLCRQEIVIVDNTPPVITCPVDLTLECSDPIPMDNATATDNCSASNTITLGFSDVVCENPIMGFTDIYDIDLWEIIALNGGEVTPMGDMQVMLESPDGTVPCPLGASVLFQITIPSTGMLVFDWDYTSNDVNGPLYDPFGYNINGTFFQLTDDLGPDMQSGTAVVSVTAGDVFAFEQNSIDCILGEGASTVVEFFACIDQMEPVCTELVIRTHTAIDECGNSSSCIQTIYRIDTTVPVIMCPANITIECDESVDPANTGLATATDNCDTDIEITYSDVVTQSVVCPQEYAIERTWTATDNCGNSATCLQSIVVDDSLPPTITFCPADVTIECDESTDPADTGGFASATDNCTTAPVVTYSDAITLGECPQEYTITRTWTATDACGNATNCIQVVTIDDSVAPTITLCPADITIECDESTDPLNTGLATATDNCDTAPMVTYGDAITAGACPQEYTIDRTWIATDACGNSSTCLQVIVVDDSVAPVITDCPSDITIECDEDTSPDNTGFASATDNCDTAPVVTYSDSVAPGACPQESTITRTWTATDACGNSSICLQVIVVDDSTPPTIVCPADLTLECTDPIPTDLATATDNCSETVTVTYTDVACDNPVMGFTGPYDFSLWTTIIPIQGGSVTTMSDNEVMLVSPDDVTIGCNDAAVQFSIVIPSTGQIVFDWNYTTNDVDGPSFDPFGYNLNGTFFQLTDDNGADTQSGAISIAVTAGDVFAFEQQSSDCALGEGATTVVEFFACIEQMEETCTSLIIRTHTATDECGNESSCAQTIFIEDTTTPVLTCPDDIIIECDASTLPDNTGMASATDNCDTTPEITYSDVITPSAVCSQEYTIARTWTVVDACDNGTNCTQIITVDDSLPPTITSCPADITIECDESTDPLNTGLATATDNCDSAPIVTYNDAVTIGACPQESTISRTWIATDACGNSSTCLQVIVVDDSVAPVITDCPSDITIECDEDTTPDNTGFASATDNCDTAPIVTYSDSVAPGACPQESTILRTWTATDACGNSSTCLQTITVDDSTAPTLVCATDITIECDESTDPASTGVSTATDNCDPAPVVTYSDSVAAGTCPQESTISRTWTATDACGNISTCVQTITIEDTTPPTLTCAEDITIECDESTDPANTGLATATDNCDTAPLVTYSDVTLSGECAQEYTITRTWTATDACGNATNCIQTITVEDTTAPTITSCPADITVECDESVDPADIGLASATDNCDPAPVVTYSDATVAGACPQEYTITRTWVATDACGNSSTCLQIVTIEDTTPPTINCPGDITLECTDNTTPDAIGEASATDNCDVAPVVTYNDTVEPGACPQESTIVRTWTATDACGNSSTCLQTITVDDSTAPTLVCAANITIECDESTDPANTGLSTATDNCDPAPVVTYSDGVEPGACPQESTIFRTWTATDACGNITTCSQTITVDDSTPPTLTCSNDITIECDESTDPLVTGLSSATDNCDPAPNVTYSDVTTSGECAQEYTITRTWTATDACGNATNCIQTIAVEDNTAPVITCPDDVTIECSEDTSPAANGLASATDNCSITVAITNSDQFSEGDCPQEYTITRTWIAQDECGNTSTCAQIIVVEDTTPPVVACPEDITIDCNDSTDPDNTGFASATDNCDFGGEGGLEVDYSDVTIEDGCPEIIERTWTSTDACGNVGTCVQTITIDDTEAPTIICPDDVTVECASDVPPILTGGVTVSDNCGFVTVTHEDDVVTDSLCVNQFTISRIYLATDECGNTATCAQSIIVDDQTPPSITCPADITVTCDLDVPDPDITSVTATDNCIDPVTITHGGDVITSQICADRYTLIRTYIATDACGNANSCFQTITVFDDIPPAITCPANVTVSCANDVPVVDEGTVVTTDNCGGDVTVAHLGDVISGQTCPNRFTVTRTYSATDDCGNSATCTQVITVFDNTPPVITCPPNITVAFGDSTEPGNTGNPTGSDNCGGTPGFTSSDMIVPGACDEEFTINRTWTATDACGLTSTCVQVIFVDGDCIVDLALTKVLLYPAEVNGGDDVVFEITITNEGEVTVGSVVITDYIPLGFTLNDPAWTPGNQGSTGQSASITLSVGNGGLDANGLNPGEFVTVQITLQANEDIAPSCYMNFAEISFIFDMNGMDISDQDIDSDPDQVDTNDPPGEDDIDEAIICVLPDLVVDGDGYVCPGEIVTYCVTNYNPEFEYEWSINGGGTIIGTTGECITVEWQEEPGGPFEISVNAIACAGCNTFAFLNVYIQGVETLACNDYVQISLGEECETVLLSGVILEGEAEGNNNYFVIITDENGNVIPDATLTSEHIGQCFTVTVANECNDQSCWGTVCVEDKIPPVIECTDVTVSCGTSLEPVFAPPVTGTIVGTVYSGLPIGPGGGTITTQQLILDLPANAVVTDIDITIDLDHTWVGDLTVELISPAGTNVLLVDQLCGAVDNWDNVTFDDQAGLSVAAACNPIPPALSGSVIPEGSLATINGQSAVGAWTLVITDQVGGDGGTLNVVSLDVEYYLAVPSAPFASDACGEVELTYTDSLSGDACEELILIRTWTATDGSANTATCIQNITITPLTLDNVDFPLAYEGECGESIHPDFTGWPTVDGTPITDESDLCNIFVGYWDKELSECGGGRKIVRTWTVLDWCEVELVEAIQVIKLTDEVGPELTCPADFSVGTDFWYCYANVSVPKPIAIDECSEIASYSLVSSSGIVVSFGNNFVINGLELGTHFVTWTVTDECGNSSTCSFAITVVDDVVPVANCDAHTIVSLTNDGPSGITLVPASVFDDGSYDNCGPVTFRARRMDSCIEFDWTTEGACIDDVPGGIPPVNSRDRGTVHRPCVPFACCDVGAGPVMVELEVTDAAGNVNYCMIEAIVQDKISPYVECPPDIIVSCDFWFNVQEGTFVDGEGNNDGSLDEDPLSAVFGNMFDGFRYDESIRQPIIINDPGNDEYNQPYNWGLDGWADDNCEVNLSVRVRVIDDCSGDDLPGNAPDGAIKLIERRFSAADGNEGVAPGTCTQRIWVVDYEPFYITDQTCNNPNPQDNVIWPCDVLLTTCPEDLGNTGEPTIFDDACSLIGVTYEDQRFDFVDDACFKILREWSVIDWCQYNSQTGAGLWKYTQVIKVHDEEGPTFVEPCETQVLCVADEGVTLPDNNQAFLGENNPLSSSCSVHLNLTKVIHETCSDVVSYDVKIYPFNGTEFILIKPTSTATVDENNDAVLSFDTRQSTIQSIRLNGLPYNSVSCGDYHRILWSVEDGCGNWSHCEYLLRLEDCKQPSPVCINGLSTVVMPIGGEVTIWAKDFNASSFDDCTPAADLLYSFSGDAYQPSFTYNCDNIPAFNVELSTEIWVADGGTDDNCNGIISWDERNKDYCTTTIVITDNNNVCEGSGSVLAGEVMTEQTNAIAQVAVALTSPGHFFPQYVTAQDGKFVFSSVPLGDDYMITPERNDGHRNGVSTLDLVRIQKHLLGKEVFTSPYQYIAADANNTESLSAIDLIEIRKLILGIYTEFPANKSWRFVEKGFPMDNENPWPFNEQIEIPELAHDSMMYNDFVGVKIGDVNNSAQANNNQILPRNGRRVLQVELDAPTDVVAGEMVVVKLRIPEIMEGFQWTLETEGLAFESVSSETMNITDSHIGILHDGVVTMSWHAEDQEALSAAQIVTMNFIVTQSGAISEMIHLTSRITEAEAYTIDGEILDVKLGQTGVTPEFALYQNRPNPWNDVTTVGFDIPSDASVTFTLFEASGKVVKLIERDCKAGYNTITLNAQEIPTNGVMYYRLESGEYSASKKMVLIK